MRPVGGVAGSGAGARDGLTLLEVLIACGLLIIGLSTMAALLPAAGFRLAQAQLEDRASVLAANALAEVKNRQVAAADAFSPGSASTLAFGSVLGTLPSWGLLPSGRNADQYFGDLSPAARARSGASRTFLLEDELIYDRSGNSGTPTNSFISEALGTGPRGCKKGVCWGATLTRTSDAGSAKPGDEATLTVAVFKKGDEFAAPLPVVLARVNGFYQADVSLSGSLLRACSWVLAVPSTPARPPEWFQIMSSWIQGDAASRVTRLIFRDQQSFESLTGSPAAGNTATIFVFDGLVRTDQHRVTLN